eukprot:4637882-Pleurochrysis_carterae.AAC.4
MHVTSGSDRATVRGARAILANQSTTRLATVRERAQARGLSAPTGATPVKGAQRASTSMRERGFQNLGSGAQALR